MTEQNEQAQELQEAAPKKRRLNEDQIREKYPDHNIKEGSLRFLEAEGKQIVVIICACGNEREVRTSDLFQVTKCRECKALERKAKRQKPEAAEAVEAEATTTDETEAPATVDAEELAADLAEAEAEVA